MAGFYENESNPIAEGHYICIFVWCHLQHVTKHIADMRQHPSVHVYQVWLTGKGNQILQ